jgi:hypothetical protein
VRLVLVDQAALGGATDDYLEQLLSRHQDPAPVLLATPTRASPEGPWQQVIRRPASIADIVGAVQTLVPLPPGSDHPID